MLANSQNNHALTGEELQMSNNREALWSTYAPPSDLIFTHGIGTKLYAEGGREYLDFVTGIAVNSFGHAHPKLIDALQQQALKCNHLSNLYRVPLAESLAKRLCEHSFADKVFFTNSGTESIEAGIKCMRRYHYDNGQPERFRVLSFHGAFHGRSMAALALAGNPAHCRGFIPFDYGFDQLPWGDIDAVRNALTNDVAGVVIEPIQGEGGIRVASSEFLMQLRQTCDEHGILLMYDEVQSGVGRSGKLFAYQHSGVKPDVMALAKGLGGGFPVGACLTSAKVSSAMTVGTHGTTFGGNPLAMSVANAVLDLVLEPQRLPEVHKNGTYFSNRLRALVQQFPDVVSDVSGRGFMIGLTCVVPNIDVLAKLRDKGLLAAKCGSNMIRFLPPLNVSMEELEQALAIVSDVLADITGKPA